MTLGSTIILLILYYTRYILLLIIIITLCQAHYDLFIKDLAAAKIDLFQSQKY